MASIRPFRVSDGPALAALFLDAVRVGGLRHYSPAQVEAWAASAPAAGRFEAHAKAGWLILVAVDLADEPLAYAELEGNGHIDHLYCRPDVIGTGLASALYDRLERAARDRGLDRLFVEASEGAVGLFASKGFAVSGRRDFLLRGVAMHNYSMEKSLAPAQEPREAD